MPTLTLLLTARIGGALELLPRLYSFLKVLKAEADGPAHHLDLGESCAPDVWHCAATAGRSVLVALDAMGCAAANARALSPLSREKLLDAHPPVALIDTAHPHTDGPLIYALRADHCAGDGHLCVLMTPVVDNAPRIEGDCLHLPRVDSGLGEVGVLMLAHESGGWRVAAWRVARMPSSTPPDPTIAGVVDFVLDEARYYQQRRAEKVSPAHAALIAYTADLIDDSLDGLRRWFSAVDGDPDHWDGVKTLAFLIARAANEYAEALVLRHGEAALVKGGRARYSARLVQPLDLLVPLVDLLLTRDATLGAHLHVVERVPEGVVLRFGPG